MTSDDGLVTELAARMHRADHDLASGDGDDGAGDGAGATPDDGAAEAPLVDLDTYEAAHEVSRWTDDEAPRARRRRTT